ncbi:DNA-binding HxlR family transcriptional regulator [Weissella beninensis]|uniref:Helix-turn-helix transcriptional regulator n=1 Tax=Periweissella beninensis TaxID=504936 RepID=A0ABT0VIA8_9LACO|nr:helix-turn-helix domain-containing protein [Periweissella beninensis]MBM7544230.1 DNA-binding HxlR family transcriptional regulator [Periweissella beninensis]MCM2437563.1 helix-turn-helix transcriptional regulator [Periweissella beninensis]
MEKIEVKTNDNLTLCPKFAKTFEILGRKWNGMIIEVLLNNGVSRFKDLATAVSTCSDRVLVERLKELEEEGIVERRTYDNSSLIQYALTERGDAMRDLMVAIHDWADNTYTTKA